tara:strand:+ start:512 stop:724 length:213 start_codon:yes stop_codon:yes gene_type:complete
MSSNGYEIRQGLLSQAQEILQQKWNAEYDRVRFLLDLGVFNPSTVTWPTPPRAEDIIEEAEKLYQFVQKK